jgi:hypothetical protein
MLLATPSKLDIAHLLTSLKQHIANQQRRHSIQQH